MKPTLIDPTVYGKDYYDHMCSVPYDRDQPIWRKHFQKLAATLIERYHPETLMDVGCAKGFLVEHLRDAGVEAFGVDVSPCAISEVREDLRQFFCVAHGAEPLSGQFDIITCIEVAEHMPESDACVMIEEICRHTDQVIFSSTDSDFEEPTHINIHPKSYWMKRFQQQGFYPDYNFDPEFITPHAIRFIRCKKPALQVGIFSHEPPNCAVALLRLAGTIRHLERQGRMQLQWNTARDPQIDIQKLLESDLFVLHREFSDRRFSKHIVAAIQEIGKPIVFELDDLLINVPVSNPHHKYSASITPDILAMLRLADFVTVTTEPLKCYLEEAVPQTKDKTFVLPNYINLDIWNGAAPPQEKFSNPFVIGWFGTATHDEDLGVIKPAIIELARKYRGKLIFKFWGYLPKDLEGIHGVQLVRGSQPDLRLHARDVINSRIDLAIAPLLDHPFNHAKSDLKWLEYSICFIPAIYSTISPYVSSVKHGRTGWLVDNRPELWVEAIEMFMQDNQLRRTIAIQAYNEVRQNRCVNVGAEYWDALYRSFHVSGPKPRSVHVHSTSELNQRASAQIMLYQANILAEQGQSQQAAKICDQAIAKWTTNDTTTGDFISTSLKSYSLAVKMLRQTADLTANLKAASTIAEAGLTEPAVRFYLQTLKLVQDKNDPNIVLMVIIEVARAFQKLDTKQGEHLLDLGTKLAKSINNQPMLKIIEQLRLNYRDKTSDKRIVAKFNGYNITRTPSFKEPLIANPTAEVPQVSIVIPTFNNFALTQSCLESLKNALDATVFEIIVVDNASTDATVDFLREHEKNGQLRLIANSDNTGFAHACNQGAQIARSPLLLFLNNDTKVTPGWLDAMVQAAQQPMVGIVGAKLLYANGRIQHAGIGFINGVPDHPHRHADADAPEVTQSRELDMVTGACLMIEGDLFLQLAGFDETYRNGVEDIDLCLRARAAGRKIVFEPKAVVYHLEGQSPGRFNHVNENLKIFFSRWEKLFDEKNHFIVPHPAKIIVASRSLLLKPAQSEITEPIRIDWIGSYLDHGSLSHVNRELTGALKATLDFQLNRINNNVSPSPGFENLSCEISATSSADAAVTVRHAWPPDWKRPRQGKLAVIQPWEFGALPEDWVRQSRDVDEFWVPSNFVRNCYIQSGIPAQKVVVVPNGVGVEKFHPQVAPMKLATQKKFKFLFVGGTIGRKGPDLLLNAYLKNFKNTDDVCVVIKDFGGKSVYAGQTFESQIRAAQSLPDAPEILYLNEELPPDALPGLYTACDCLVLPYRGEGFGLPVLEAMACGLPVIVTAGGATDDFVRDEFAWRIPAARKIFGKEAGGMKLAGDGWLLEPDLAVLGQQMRRAFENPGEARERGKLASRHAHEFCSWKNSAAIVAQRIRELGRADLRANRNMQRRVVAELPAVAQIGQLNEAREVFGQKKFQLAWENTIDAIAKRPFHPEAFLLLAEIALAAGDSVSARECAQRARDCAPGWSAPKQFLKKPLRGNAKPEWLKLTKQIGNRKSEIGNELSICLIVKNEEQFLAQCLKSIRNVAQQIVVVDTGSTDRTVEIAKEFGAEIHSFVWCDDFAAARNAALEHATGDWILMLDADEELPEAQHEKLRADMKKSDVIACRLPLVNREKENEGQSFVPRLFRNAPGVYYSGRVHEQVFPSLVAIGKPWGLHARFGTAQLLHHGYTKEMIRDRNKIERNLKLLRQAVEENPADANLMMNFGLELVRSDDLAGGVAKYRAAFELMSAQSPDETAPELREVLLTQFTCQLYKVRAHEEVVRVLQSPLAKKTGLTASLHFALGLSQFELKNFGEAAKQMQQCLAKRKQATLSPINTDILTVAPEHCLALSLAKTGDVAGAEKTFQKALAESGQNNFENVKLDYAKFLAGQNRFVEALQKLHEMVAANARNTVAWRTGGEIALGRAEFLEFARDWTGEAMRYVAEDLTVVAQRAEALMLNGDTAAAMEFWERIWNSERQPRILAALILCETIDAVTTHAPDEGGDESATSRAFIAWYQRLIAMRVQTVIGRINEQTDKLSRALPTAAKMIEKALAETRLQAAANREVNLTKTF